MINLAIVISSANAVTDLAESLMTVFIKGSPAIVIPNQAVNSATLEGGMAFLVALGLGYGVDKFIDPLFKHKDKQKNTKAEKPLKSHS